MADPFDLIVVGSGAAGLSAALRAAELGARVCVLTAGELLAGSSVRAQGGIAAAVGADDAPALHAADTLAVGAGLNDAAAVDVLTREGSRSLQHMWAAGTPFDDTLGLEAGHARRRILHAGGGATGQVLTSALLERATRHPRISLLDHSPVSSLEHLPEPSFPPACVSPLGRRITRIVGARVGQRLYTASAVIVATGGYGALWARSTNGPENRGSGLGLAWRAGASLADLEFVQFHPTALSITGRPAFLLSEALRGEGARLIDDAGREVVEPLLPRDVLARALHQRLQAGHPVFLSMQHLAPGPVHERFGRLAATLRSAYDGLDLARDRLPVAPAAHYCMGGIRTDTWGRTDVPGLYAAGEVACSGVQGANRLASNSLLECLVFGARAAEAALNDLSDAAAVWSTIVLSALPSPLTRSFLAASPLQGRGGSHICRWERNGDSLAPRGERVGVRGTYARQRFEAVEAAVLGARLDADLGVERNAPRLNGLIADLPAPDDARATDLLIASLVARSALLRRESRGAHFRTDAPELDPTWRGRIHWRRAHPPAFEEVRP
jgi:L-aspartate oxidase